MKNRCLGVFEVSTLLGEDGSVLDPNIEQVMEHVMHTSGMWWAFCAYNSVTEKYTLKKTACPKTTVLQKSGLFTSHFVTDSKDPSAQQGIFDNFIAWNQEAYNLERIYLVIPRASKPIGFCEVSATPHSTRKIWLVALDVSAKKPSCFDLNKVLEVAGAKEAIDIMCGELA